MAIQVGGTSVITDARALNNITSVDSTTATAIGNAGVGGTLVDLGFTSLTSTSFQEFDISMPSGYHSVYIEVFNLVTANTSNPIACTIKFKNTSGTLQESARDYWYETINSSTQSTQIQLGTVPAYGITNQYGESGHNTMSIMLSNYASSTQPTNFSCLSSGSWSYSNGSAYNSAERCTGSTRRNFTVGSIRFYNYWNFRALSNAGYQMYGWKA